ncbi:hypothetical protein [Actinokineospora inagensis]|nr:hypothetical protein [Actinokineospora inagensis]
MKYSGKSLVITAGTGITAGDPPDDREWLAFPARRAAATEGVWSAH